MATQNLTENTNKLIQKIHTQDGRAATIEVLETITGEPGTDAAVENRGSSSRVQLVFTVPRGADGRQGIDGEPGAKGDDGGFLQFECDENGNLYVVNTTGNTYTWDYDSTTGNLYVVDEDECRVLVGNIHGRDGADGADGFSPIVTATKDGTLTTITITDATGTSTVTIADGVDGQDGQDGYTPERGVDYWTAADKTEIVQAVLAELYDAGTEGV